MQSRMPAEGRDPALRPGDRTTGPWAQGRRIEHAAVGRAQPRPRTPSTESFPRIEGVWSVMVQREMEFPGFGVSESLGWSGIQGTHMPLPTVTAARIALGSCRPVVRFFRPYRRLS